MRTFTDKYIKSLKPKSKRYEVIQGRGFGIRISPSGTKSWIYSYRINGKLRRMTFGNYPDMSLADANELYAKAYALRKQGMDPAHQRQKLLESERNAETVEMLVDEYLERHAKKKKKSWREDERILNKEIIPIWGHLRAKDITRRDVVRLLDQVMDRGSPSTANHTFEIIRRMFNFAIERSILESTPCYMVKAPGQKSQRQRVLGIDEIKTLWSELDTLKCHPNIVLALKLLLVTAQRSTEISQANWAEFDFSSKIWTIPEERVKNGLSHRVPLSPLAIELLNQVKSNEPHSQWLLPSPRWGDTIPMRRSSLNRVISKYRINLKVQNWTPHDLRRTAASHITGMGIPRLVVSKILNHAEHSVTAVYDRYSYDKEKKNALYAWSTKLNQIISNKLTSNVIHLK